MKSVTAVIILIEFYVCNEVSASRPNLKVRKMGVREVKLVQVQSLCNCCKCIKGHTDDFSYYGQYFNMVIDMFVTQPIHLTIHAGIFSDTV